MDYRESGVDIREADAFVSRISQFIPQTYDERVIQGLGGFAAVYQVSDDRYLAACTDGVGTKLKWAQLLDRHHGIGVDLVAMCVNDLLCVGATPLFFLDYMAFGRLDTRVSEELVAGIVDGCRQSGMALIGGETAEMPGLYGPGEYDLAGFSVGELAPAELLTGAGAEDGDMLVGIASSGFHSNGFSLLRKLVSDDERALVAELLVPTRIYVRLFQALRAQYPDAILGAAHMTGSGIENIPRISSGLDFEITHWPGLSELPSCMATVVRRVQDAGTDLFRTFNMGIGLTLLVRQARAPALLATLEQLGERAWIIGRVARGSGRLLDATAPLAHALRS